MWGYSEILPESDDPELVTTVHDWFDAQLSDHGDDATQDGDRVEDMDASEHEQHH